MFAPKTVKLKKRAKTRFSGDLKYRVEAEFMAIFNKMKKGAPQNEKVEKMKARVELLLPAIMTCFKGKHELCDKYSAVCSATKRWKLKHKNKIKSE